MLYNFIFSGGKRSLFFRVSQYSGSKPAPLSGSTSTDSAQACEVGVRQMIANGKSRTALEIAKQFHKTESTPASECLLLDAYTARIQSLIDHDLRPEAKALLDLVRERFPSARQRFDGLAAAASARGGELSELLQPLIDPQLSPDRRAIIEQAVQGQLLDLAALADCAALPPEHQLRQAARALDIAFNLVTSGAVSDEQIALAAVSHRSPLAPWKLLIHAIACLYRGDVQPCREYLAAIKPESAPARLIPAIQAMLAAKPPRTLNSAEQALISATSISLSELRSALTNLDNAFANSEPSHIFKAVRAAIRECQRIAPDRLAHLKQLIFARGGASGLDLERLTAALEGNVRQDAEFFRTFAIQLERSGDPEDILQASELWREFHEHAVRESWFLDGGLETAALYLHVAEILGQLPEEWFEEAQSIKGQPGTARTGGVFQSPGKLYALACSIDPHPEAFAQWMRWAEGQPDRESENVAQEWCRFRPDDLDPVLHLMEGAEERNAIPTALSFLAAAEKIDAVHPKVRSARLRLLVAAAMNQLRQNKPHLAMQRLIQIEALPQLQQGARRAFVPAMLHLLALVSKDVSKAAAALHEVESLLENKLAAKLLLFGVANILKGSNPIQLPHTRALKLEERKAIPKSLAKVMAITKDLGIGKFKLPNVYFDAAEKNFPSVGNTLEIHELLLLGQLGMSTGHRRLSWAASGVGLERGGPDEARFLLMRADAMLDQRGDRHLALAAAAAELGRFHRQPDIVDRAVSSCRNPFGGESISLTLEHAREVIRRELASPLFPDRFGMGPDYRDLLPQCGCADCRRARAEAYDPLDVDGQVDDELDDAGMKKIFDRRVPPEMPPEVAESLFEIMRDAFRSGESQDAIVAEMLGGLGKKKKDRKIR